MKAARFGVADGKSLSKKEWRWTHPYLSLEVKIFSFRSHYFYLSSPDTSKENRQSRKNELKRAAASKDFISFHIPG